MKHYLTVTMLRGVLRKNDIKWALTADDYIQELVDELNKRMRLAASRRRRSKRGAGSTKS